MEPKSNIEKTPKIKKKDSINPDVYSDKTGKFMQDFVLESAGK
jgi:hypothetical protein